MIFIIIGIIILFYSLANFQKGFLYYLVFRVLLVTNITIISQPGLPMLSLDVFMTLVMIGIFLYKRKNISIIEHRPFPFKVPFIWLTISWFLSSVFAYIGFVGAISQLVKNVCLDLMTAWMIWKLINTHKDITFLLKWLTVIFLVTICYGYYEYYTGENPLVEYEQSMVADASRAIESTYDEDSFRGYRIRSVFEHPIGAGINWAMYSIMVLIFVIKYRWKSIYTNIALITTALSIPCIIFTNSRAPIVFIIIAFGAVVNLKKRKFYSYLATGIVLAVIILPFFSDYANNLLSIFDSSAQEEVGGSDAEMRFDQLAAAISIMQQSPILGYGFKFMNAMDTALTRALLSLESIWFVTLTQFGILGIVAYLITCYYSIVKIPLKYNSWAVFFIALAYWTTYSLTSVPGMLIHLYYYIIIIIIKLSYNK